VRVLVLGATGMLGHKLMQRSGDSLDVTGTVRGEAATYRNHPVLQGRRLLGGVSAENFDSVVLALAVARPEAVINCIGIIKQLPAAKDPLPSLTINALFPHRLAHLCQAAGVRLVHISTDCVFSGRRGNYSEDDISDAEDLYGRTKYLGEVSRPGCLTLRTSIIGRELHSRVGLLEWFISQRGGRVRGYTKAIYSGFTTQVIAELIASILEQPADLQGLWHVSSAPISKYDLLMLVNQAMELGITIEPDETFVCDRSLDSSRFRQKTGYQPPSWSEMVKSVAEDSTPYDSYSRKAPTNGR